MTGISNNLVIYGHHMNDGSMFADLCKYTDADFYKEHPTIAFDTLSGLGKYEVVAAFKFNTNRETFKYNEYTLIDIRTLNLDPTDKVVVLLKQSIIPDG